MAALAFGCLGCGDDTIDSKGSCLLRQVFSVPPWKYTKDSTSEHKVLDHNILFVFQVTSYILKKLQWTCILNQIDWS